MVMTMMMMSTCYISSSSTTSSFPHFRTLFSVKRKEKEQKKKKRRSGALLLLHSTSILGISTTATISSSAAAAKKQQLQQQQHQVNDQILHSSSSSSAVPFFSIRALGEDGLKASSLVGRGIVAALLIFVQTFSTFLPPPALAVLYSPDTKVPRTGELALRRAIPANPNMKDIQESLEDISYLLRIPQRKPFGTMEADVRKALKIATEGKDSILGTLPEELKDKGSLLYTSLIDGKVDV